MNARKLADDCFVHDRDRLLHEDAIALLRGRLPPIADQETVTLKHSLGRILAQNCTAPRAIPAHDNAAVDGYAIRHTDLKDGEPTHLPVAGRVTATIQRQFPSHKPGTATRIFTGAVMPEGADTVVMQEDCEIGTDRSGAEISVLIPPGLKHGANRRLAGEDVTPGAVLLNKGDLIRPQDLARLASAGFAQIHVFQRLRIGIYSTGDELRATDCADLPVGAVYDANQPMLAGLAEVLPVETLALGILPDQAEAVQSSLQEAADSYDVIITSGGASIGEEDHLRTALQALGTCHLWQLAIKPGRPMMMGQIGTTPVFGLPGNPVAVFVCWLLYVYPAILRLAGAPWREPQKIMLPAEFSVPRKKSGRREFFRGWPETKNGHTVLRKFQRDGSGLISGLQAASGLIEVAESVERIDEGDMLAFLPFAQFGIRS